MSTATANWTLTYFDTDEIWPRIGEWPVVSRTAIWEHAAQEDHLAEIALLADDWDGCGALAVSNEAIAHARTFLDSLSVTDSSPNTIVPTAAGTLLFEWETSFGSAHLEIGKSTFGFYTSPVVGESIMIGGQIGVLNAEQIRVALATIFPETDTFSLAISDNSMGF